MHSGQEGTESKNILPKTRDVRFQGANVVSNAVVYGISHNGADLSNRHGSRGMGDRGCKKGMHSCCNVGLVLGSSGLQGRNPLVRIAHEHDEQSEGGGSGRDHSVDVGARVLEVSTQFVEGIDRADTIVELVMKVRQSRIGSASVLHESLSPNVGVDGFLQVREVGDSRHK